MSEEEKKFKRDKKLIDEYFDNTSQKQLDADISKVLKDTIENKLENQKLKKELDTIKSRIHLKVEKAERKYKNTKSNLKKIMLELKIGTLKDVLYEEYYSDKKPHKYVLENMVNKNKELIKENELKSKVINEMTKEILGEYKGYEPCPLEEETDCKLLNCEDCIKEYFYKKAQEEK